MTFFAAGSSLSSPYTQSRLEIEMCFNVNAEVFHLLQYFMGSKEAKLDYSRIIFLCCGKLECSEWECLSMTGA